MALEELGAHLAVGIVDLDGHSWSHGGHRAGQDLELAQATFGLFLGRLGAIGAAQELGSGVLQLADLLLQAPGLGLLVVQQLDEVALPHGGELRLLGLGAQRHHDQQRGDEQDGRYHQLALAGAQEGAQRLASRRP